MFVCPGIYGDDKRLAQFRRLCAPMLDMILVDLPAPDAAARLLGSLHGTGAWVGRAIEALQPAGRVCLAGYSYGGNVAFETTHYLLGRGRLVSLALIDAYLADPQRVMPGRRPPALRRWLWRAFDIVCLWDGGRRHLLGLVGRLWPAKRSAIGRRMLWSLRRRSVAAWRPQPLTLRVLVIMSEPFAAGLSRWHHVTPNAVVVAMPCDHWEILMPPAASSLRDALVAHIDHDD